MIVGLNCVVVESANVDAWDLVRLEAPFNASTADGNRYLMIAVIVTNKLGDSTPVEVDGTDFSIVGSSGMYRDWLEWGCGFRSDALDATLYNGGSTRGNICFEVGVNETGFILSHGGATWASLGSLGDK